MALIPIDQVGQIGVVKDIHAWQLPPNAWTDGNNVRVLHGGINHRSRSRSRHLANTAVTYFNRDADNLIELISNE